MGEPDGAHRRTRGGRVNGGGGIRKALRHARPHARVQRCLFHICPDIGAILGTNPRHEASRQLLRPAKELTRVHDADAMGAYNAWELRHKDFLEQKSIWADGSENDLHQRLIKARDMLPGAFANRPCSPSWTPVSTPTGRYRPATMSSNRKTRASATCCAPTAA